jgi:hypothetical protein
MFVSPDKQAISNSRRGFRPVKTPGLTDGVGIRVKQFPVAEKIRLHRRPLQ